eukprot:GHVU01013451.1.p1 GENE.GHVU01013451.1~~GHVU01013451.1.p1  ORF type:complete len:272 (-),score=51.55 GHVU01013451.1:302-1117(-)
MSDFDDESDDEGVLAKQKELLSFNVTNEDGKGAEDNESIGSVFNIESLGRLREPIEEDGEDGDSRGATQTPTDSIPENDEQVVEAARVKKEGREETPHTDTNRQQEDKKSRIQLPAVSDLFARTKLSFKSFADQAQTDRAKKEREESEKAVISFNHVPASSIMSGDKPNMKDDPKASAKAKAKAKPKETYRLASDTGWHVPLTLFDVAKKPDSEAKGQRVTTDGEGRGSRKTKHTDGLTVKDRERNKRAKGQSSQTSWKPEVFMRMRQEFD